jgi:uncharacterized membrane protein
MIDTPPAIESEGLIARFMTASTPVEVYLQQHGPLSPLELDSLTLTLRSLQTFLDIWKQKEGPTGN